MILLIIFIILVCCLITKSNVLEGFEEEELSGIRFDTFTNYTYKTLANMGYLTPLPEEFNEFNNRDLPVKEYLLLPCIYASCQRNSFYLFIKLALDDIQSLIKVSGKKEFVINYTTDGKWKGNNGELTIEGDWVEKRIPFTEYPILMGTIRGGSYVYIKAHYEITHEGKTIKGKETPILPIQAPVINEELCNNIPYLDQSMIYVDGKCRVPSKEELEYLCLTSNNPLNTVSVWDYEKKKCINLKGKEQPSLKDTCEDLVRKLSPDDYCEGQEVSLDTPIEYKCEPPTGNGNTYEKNGLYKQFRNKINTTNPQEYWEIDNLERVWEKVYECDYDFNGKTIDKLPCLKYIDNKEVCLNHRKRSVPKCIEWEFNPVKGKHVCRKCEGEAFGDNCEIDPSSAKEMYPNCAKFDYIDNKFVCSRCKPGYFDYKNGCNRYPGEMKERYPDTHCDTWQWDGKDFTCTACSSPYRMEEKEPYLCRECICDQFMGKIPCRNCPNCRLVAKGSLEGGLLAYNLDRYDKGYNQQYVTNWVAARTRCLPR